MRNLRLQVQLSVDGYNASKDGQLDWMVWDWDNKLKQYTQALTDPVDTILLGRKMTDGFISHWAKAASDPGNPEYEAGRKFTDTPKIVFTRTLNSSRWPNTTLAKGDLKEEVNNLKNSRGGDIIVYGGSNFVSNLIKGELIDEYQLYINPVMLGEGKHIFDKINSRQKLELIKSIPFECGITVLHYELKK
jgi:dihydrofolate reductase